MPSTNLATLLGLSLLTLAGACGVSVTNDATSTGAGAGSGAGAGGDASTSGAGTGGGSSVCPTDIPGQGATCSDASLICQYGACCPATATCDGSHWNLSLPPCVSLSCPLAPPADGEPCDICSFPPACDIP